MENTVRLFGLVGFLAIGLIWMMAHVNFWFNRSDGRTWGLVGFFMTAMIIPALCFTLYLDLVK